MLIKSASPQSTTALVGRGSEIGAVVDLLAGGRVVTLTGPPGVGKTRLARAVAEQAGEAFDDGVAWVDLTAVRDAAQVPAEVARALEAGSGPTTPARPASAALPDRDALLVLDNCEHVLEAAADIASAAAATTRLRVLATSRERLRLVAEREFAVPPLPMPTRDDLDDLDALRRNQAMALLLARAPGGVALTPRTARPLAEICLRMDGLPLALELAAARLRVFTPAELAFRLEHRTASLSTGPRDAPARHRDLRSAIAWSYDLLSERDRIVFRRLAAFPTGWTVTAAEAVCAQPDVLDAIESLLDKSLIRRAGADAEDTRFTMLMSLREFADQQLSAHDEQHSTRDRHAGYFARLCREWEHTVGTDAETTTLRLLGTARADLRTALDHAEGSGDTGSQLWLAVGLGWYCYTRGQLGEAVRVVAAMDAVLAIPDVADNDSRAAATLISGILTFALADIDAAAARLELAHELARASGDARRSVTAEAFLGHVARDRGDRQLARRRYEHARELYEQLGIRRGVAWADHDLALLEIDARNWTAAQTLSRDAIARFELLDYDWAVATATHVLGRALLGGGAVEEAAAALAGALTMTERVGDRRGVAQGLEALAQLAFGQGRAAWSARLVGAAQAERTRAQAAASAPEAARLSRLEADIRRLLGGSSAEHELHAGRTMPAGAVRDLVATVTAPPPPGADDLTPRQHEVAALIADGRTNRQISSALGISEKTAEVHVHNIMTRLGTPSRAAVAAWVARQTR